MGYSAIIIKRDAGVRDLANILVVEDEEDIRKIVQISLENVGGFKVKLSASAHEALDALTGFAPDLILLDVMMPMMDGISLLTEIRKADQFNDIPVIFMTAKVQSHEIDAYKNMGVLGIITKPFDPVSLPEQIKDFWLSLETA